MSWSSVPVVHVKGWILHPRVRHSTRITPSQFDMERDVMERSASRLRQRLDPASEASSFDKNNTVAVRYGARSHGARCHCDLKSLEDASFLPNIDVVSR